MTRLHWYPTWLDDGCACGAVGAQATSVEVDAPTYLRIVETMFLEPVSLTSDGDTVRMHACTRCIERAHQHVRRAEIARAAQTMRLRLRRDVLAEDEVLEVPAGFFARGVQEDGGGVSRLPPSGSESVVGRSTPSAGPEARACPHEGAIA